MELLNDMQAELITGGSFALSLNNGVSNSVGVATGDIYVAPVVRTSSATQINANSIVSAFGGYKSTYIANIASYQFNGII